MSEPSGMAAVQSRIAEVQSRIARLSGQPQRVAVGASTGAADATALVKSAGASLTGAGGQGGAFADALAAVQKAAVGKPAAAADAAGKATTGKGTGAGVVASAMKHLGLPYIYGGNDPSKGLDCSSLVQLAMRENGVDVPRTARQQARVGTAVPSLDKAKPGDLIVLRGGAHIGIYVGDGKMVHAPKTGDVIKVAKVWETPMTIRRLVPEAAAGGDTVRTAAAVAAPAALRPASAGSGPAAPYQGLFDAATAKHGLPTGLLSAVAKTESSYNPRAISPAGARGLMQIMPGTAKDLKVDPMDPAQAVDGAARLLASHLKTFDSLPLALAAYNAGPGNVRKYGGIPPFTETQNYVRKVTAAQRTL